MPAPNAMLTFVNALAALPGRPTRPFPLWDWQFWVVTLIAAVAASWIAFKLFPRRLLGKRRRGPAKRATLTIGGRPVEAGRDGAKCH